MVMLIVILSAGIGYSVAIFKNTTTLTVKEPLQVSPSSATVTAWSGGTSTYDVNVCNQANFPIPGNFKATVTTVPTNGLATDVVLFPSLDHIAPLPATLTIPAATITGASCLVIHVDATVSNAAVPGDYAIENTFTKV